MRIKSLALFLLTFLVVQARAFTLLNPSAGRPLVQGFPSGDINVVLNSAGCPIDLEPIIKDALAVWNVVPSSRLWLKYEGTTTATTAPGKLLVQCSSDVGDNNTTIGIGGAVYPSGPIESGWLYMNASSGNANIANFSRSVVVTAMAHEMGHALGFGHSQDSNAIMYFAVGQRDPILLTADDIDGVNFLYNRDELGGDKMMGCATVGAPRAGGPGQTLWTALFLLLPFVALGRKRATVRARSHR